MELFTEARVSVTSEVSGLFPPKPGDRSQKLLPWVLYLLASSFLRAGVRNSKQSLEEKRAALWKRKHSALPRLCFS